MRILHAPYSVAGNAWSLSRAERDLGHVSDTMVFSSSPYGYAADIDLALPGRSRKGVWWQTGAFFVKALARYDLFHFNFGGSLFSYIPGLELRDLPILKALGKKIVFTFQGCDVRDRYYCLEHFSTSACASCDVKECDRALCDRKKRMIEMVSRHADRMYVLNPDLLPMVPGAEFLPYASIAPALWKQVPRDPGERPFRILHAPTSRAIKGTTHVIEAVERLKKRGIPVELLLVEKVAHQEARELYRKAHLAIDQLLIGWYGAFATETMALGIPTLCYIREQDLGSLPFRERIPLARTSKETLEDDILALMENGQLWQELRTKGRAYVEELHDPGRVAAQVLESCGSPG